MKQLIFTLLFSASIYSQEFLKISAGYITGYAFHELGHSAASEITGSKYHYIYKNEPYYIIEKTKHPRYIATAGFMSDALIAEVCLIGDMNAYKKGIVLHSIINPIVYIVRDAVTPYGDIKYFRESGGDTNLLRAAIFTHAFFTAYRLYNKESKLIPYVGYNQIGVIVKL